ncbi:MAG: serine protease [Candidatus Pacebacteria bacterium]|nr:serine protease [Candidatus Paceibacterota bacterium]
MTNKKLFTIFIFILLLQSVWFYYLISNISKVEVVQKQETVVLSQTDFLKNYLKEIQNTVLSVTDLNTSKQGSGIVLTSDGLILTLASNVPKNDDFDFKFLNKSKVYEIKKRDLNKDLALVQIGEVGLTPCVFSVDSEVYLGEEVYILGVDKESSYVFGEGYIKTIKEDIAKTNILGDDVLNGAPVYNNKGEVLGISKVNNNLVEIILINNIKDFINL